MKLFVAFASQTQSGLIFGTATSWHHYSCAQWQSFSVTTIGECKLGSDDVCLRSSRVQSPMEVIDVIQQIAAEVEAFFI